MTRPYRGGNVERELHGDTRKRLLREEQKLDELPKTGQFSLITGSRAEGTFTMGFGSFVSTPWSPHIDTVIVVGLWAGVGVPDAGIVTSVELLRNGLSVASLSIPAAGVSAQTSCSVVFTPSDVLTFSLPDNSASWDLLTVYAVVNSAGQSAGLDFQFSTRPI